MPTRALRTPWTLVLLIHWRADALLIIPTYLIPSDPDKVLKTSSSCSYIQLKPSLRILLLSRDAPSEVGKVKVSSLQSILEFRIVQCKIIGGVPRVLKSGITWTSYSIFTLCSQLCRAVGLPRPCWRSSYCLIPTSKPLRKYIQRRCGAAECLAVHYHNYRGGRGRSFHPTKWVFDEPLSWYLYRLSQTSFRWWSWGDRGKSGCCI